MPSITTHHIFAEDLYEQFDEDTKKSIKDSIKIMKRAVMFFGDSEFFSKRAIRYLRIPIISFQGSPPMRNMSVFTTT